MRTLLVAGARPNFMKVAPILVALESEGHETVLVHTGQHYDVRMSDSFFQDLGLPEPHYHLAAGSGSHAAQTARVMQAFEPVLLETRPDWVIVVGDVNSTLACALVAVKLKEETGCRIAHVEAGLRSGDWRMPEEVNRVLTDRLSDVLLTPSEDALPNLLAEGIPADRIEFVGNVMIDTLLQQLPAARALDVPARLGLRRCGYAVATSPAVQRRRSRYVARGARTLAEISREMPVVLPIHPRTRKNVAAFGIDALLTSLHRARAVGVPRDVVVDRRRADRVDRLRGTPGETTALGVPCVTLRNRPSSRLRSSRGPTGWRRGPSPLLVCVPPSPPRSRSCRCAGPGGPLAGTGAPRNGSSRP